MKHQHQRRLNWTLPANRSRRSSAQVLCALVVMQCVGCGTQSVPLPEDAAKIDRLGQPSAASEAGTQPAMPPVASRGTSQPSAQDSLPAEARNQQFDWLKFTKPGDVTGEILPFMHNGELDLGTEKIAASGAVKLVKAEIEAGKLLLTLQMKQPKQRVRFEGLRGALGNYRPNGHRLRPVSIRDASQVEQFALAGVLQIGINHPHPERIQVAAVKPPSQIETFRQSAEMMRQLRKQEAEERARQLAQRPVAQKPSNTPAKKPLELIPGPETGYTPRSLEFARLAAAVSAMYKMPGRDTFRPVERARLEAGRAAAAYPDQKLQQYAVKMLDRLKADQNIDVPAVRRQLMARANQLAQKTLEYGAVQGSYTDSDGSTKTVLARGNEPDLAAQRQAEELFALAKGSDDAIRAYAKQQRNQNTFLDLFAGDGISNRVEDLYQNIVIDSYRILREEAQKAAGPKSPTCLIALLRPDSSTPGLRNASGKKLTDVVVDLSWGFTRSEKLKDYGHDQFVFIPVWKPNEELELQKIKLREPSVMHARVNVYANEARSEEHAFSLIDPSSPPNNKPGVIVLSEQRGFASLGKPSFAGVAWVEVAGKRVDWKAVERPLEVSVEPGEHKVIVHAQEKRRKAQIVYEGTVRMDGNARQQIEVDFQKRPGKSR